jgi:hypothetical protein
MPYKIEVGVHVSELMRVTNLVRSTIEKGWLTEARIVGTVQVRDATEVEQGPPLAQQKRFI